MVRAGRTSPSLSARKRSRFQVMVSIDEELETAKAAFDTLSVAIPNIATLRKATGIARRAQVTALSSDGLLNDARHTVGNALLNLIHAIEYGPPPPKEKVDK